MRLSSTGSYPQEDLESFNPGFVDFLAADLFIAVAEVQPDETDKLLRLPGCRGLFQVRYRHKLTVWRSTRQPGRGK